MIECRRRNDVVPDAGAFHYGTISLAAVSGKSRFCGWFVSGHDLSRAEKT
jgi:hypothetical protein